jgi:hypothetical protein
VKLTENDKIRRVEVATENLEYDIDIWRKCIFIDEISFETGPKCQTRVRRFSGTRYDEDNIQKVQNSGWSSVMCCACFSYQGVGPIMRSEGNFTSEQYVHFIENQVIPYAEEKFPDSDFYILHDNSRIHTSFHTTAYLVLRLGADRIIPHAPKSPDCNPIENLFGIFCKEIRNNQLIYDNQDQLWTAIQNHWTRIDTHLCQSLADSMPQRYNEVLENNGSTTHY